MIAAISDPLKKDILLQKAAKTFDIPFESLKEELERRTDSDSAPLSPRLQSAGKASEDAHSLNHHAQLVCT